MHQLSERQTEQEADETGCGETDGDKEMQNEKEERLGGSKHKGPRGRKAAETGKQTKRREERVTEEGARRVAPAQSSSITSRRKAKRLPV